MICITMINTINNELKQLYETYLTELKKATHGIGDQFSHPILMHVFDDYEKVNRKVMFVGKETYSWYGTMENSERLNVDLILDNYKDFELAKDYHGKNSPFWSFIKTIHHRLNGEEHPLGFLYTNFSKCDSHKTTPSPELQKLNEKGFDLIKEEIKISKPDVVIFITGWEYENQFQRVFQGLGYETLIENYLYKCKHAELPAHSYMTMHPKALRLRKKFESVMEGILKAVGN